MSFERRSPRVTWMVTALLLMAVVNLVQFRDIDRQAPGVHWRAIHAFGSGHLDEIAVGPEAPTNVRERFGLSFALRAHARGATIVVPVDQGLSRSLARENLVGLGGVDGIERRTYPPTDVPPLEGTRVAAVDAVDDTPFELFVLDENADRLVLFRPSGTFVIVDERLLAPDHPAVP